VALNPPEANHHLRTDFTIKDLDAWWQQHRGELLAAILTVARGWVVAGRPSESVRSDDYAPWVNGLRGMLGWARFPGTFGGISSKVAVSADDEEWHAFLVEIHGAFGTNPFMVKDLVEQLNSFTGRIDAAMLPGDLAEKFSHIRDGRDRGFRKSLGWWLKNRLGRYASGWLLAPAEPDTKSGVARYAVNPPDQDTEDEESAADTPGAQHADDSTGFLGFSGFHTATRGTENSHLGNGAGGHRPGENPQNPETPPDPEPAQPEAGEVDDQCTRCGRPLVWPDAQQRGTCSTCWLHGEDDAS
jgi:hypothetical protein